MGIETAIAFGLSALATGASARSAKKDRKKARREARETKEAAIEETARGRDRRQSIQRAALQGQPSLFDMLGGPDG